MKNNSSVSRFLKKNGYYLLLIACVTAVIVLVVVAVATRPSTQLPPVGGGDIIDGDGDNSGDGDGDVDVDTKPIEFMLPVSNGTIGMDYSYDLPVFHITLGEYAVHQGIDFKGAENANVLAVYDGVVQSVSFDILDGTKIVISHNGELSTVYSSLAKETSIKVGDRIRQGDVLGQISDSSYNEFKEGPHVHFEVLKNNVKINPREYLKVLDK